MKKLMLSILFIIVASTSANADRILLIRGLDQFLFRGMDVLGSELRALGHDVTVSAPIFAQESFTNYDVVIGNSQGAIVAMTRKQKIKPRLIVTIDLPYAPKWRARVGVRHLNIYGAWFKTGKMNGAKNIFINKDHLTLSFDPAMRKVVKQNIMIW